MEEEQSVPTTHGMLRVPADASTHADGYFVSEEDEGYAVYWYRQADLQPAAELEAGPVPTEVRERQVELVAALWWTPEEFIRMVSFFNGLITPRLSNAPGASDAPASPSRNAPCPCGSGKKYKHCHGA